MSYEKVAQAQSNLIIGTKQTVKAMKNSMVQEVVIAEDADQHITNKILRLAHELGIPHSSVPSIKRLGKACGIDVGATVVAIKQ